MIDEATKDKLRKLLALIRDPGAFPGEKANARKIYDKLMARAGLEEADIDPEEELEIYWFKWKTEEERRLVRQIVGHLRGEGNTTTWGNRGRRKHIGIKMTQEEHIIVKGRFAILRPKLKEELARAYSAFIQANKLGVPTDGHELTPEEEAEVDRVLAMADLMRRTKLPEDRRGRLLNNRN